MLLSWPLHGESAKVNPTRRSRDQIQHLTELRLEGRLKQMQTENQS